MANTFTAMDSRPGLPLCCHYFSVHVGEQPVPMLAADGASQELLVTWALGVLRDGDWEVLGAWPVAATGSAFWRCVFDEFTARGVEGISVVLAGAIAEVRAAYSSAIVVPLFGQSLGRSHASLVSYAGLLDTDARHAVREAASVRGARVAMERLLARLGSARAAELAKDWPEVLTQFAAFYALPPRIRAVVRQADEAAEHLARSLRRAVGRHGAFPDPAAAASFVAETLAQAERRLRKHAIAVPAVPAMPVHCAAPSVAGQGDVARGL